MRTRQLKQQAVAAPKRLWSDKKLRRHALFGLGINAVAYATVYLLVSSGTMESWWANTTVSKGAAPVWLTINTLALTGRVIPTRAETAKWVACWLPSAMAGAVFLALVITHFGLGSLEARAAVGVALFPFDHLVKRFIIFTRHARLARFIFREWTVLVFAGCILWGRLRPNKWLKPRRTIRA
ncbi:hypothetical protein HYS84_02770 [Candidatus Saccharibacteria bacterium]|nr:hypothetical protein [Candidatus Saccharibacteria bacterium]